MLSVAFRKSEGASVGCSNVNAQCLNMPASAHPKVACATTRIHAVPSTVHLSVYVGVSAAVTIAFSVCTLQLLGWTASLRKPSHGCTHSNTQQLSLHRTMSAALRVRAAGSRHAPARAPTPTSLRPRTRNGSYTLFLGDSHTEGTVGCNWVDLLRPALTDLGTKVVAAGISGQCSDTIAGRLPGLLDQHGPPAAAVILAGTNNVVAASHPFYQAFYTVTRLSKRTKSDLDVYKSDLVGMVQLLQQRAPSCKVFLITIPPLCEDPNHRIWSGVLQHCDIIREVGAQFKEVVTVVDFNTTCRQYLQKHATSQQPPWPSFYLDLPVVVSGATEVLMMIKNRLLRQSYDSIAASRGRLLLHDDIHLNETAGNLLVQQLQPLLQGALVRTSSCS